MADRGVLLDTCAVIWLARGEAMSPEAVQAIRAAGLGGGIHISGATAWELSMLHTRGLIDLRPDPKAWFRSFVSQQAIRVADLTPDILMDSNSLPGAPQGDPFDRMIMATARTLGLPIVTRDKAIIAYAQAGHVDVVGA